MKAYQLEAPGKTLQLLELPSPFTEAGTITVEMKAIPLLSYTEKYLAGETPMWYPDRPFIPGTNGVGTIKEIGKNIYHFKPGERVLVDPYLKAAEAVEEPAQILTGLTGISPDSASMLNDWADGTWREIVNYPANSFHSLAGLENIPDEKLALLSKLLIPFGGLRRAGFQAGQTLIVHGATGYFASTALMLGFAMGAERVVAAARNGEALEKLTEIFDQRVVPVEMTGEIDIDAENLVKASDGGAHVSFDMIGGANSPNGTLATLKALKRGGKLVLMGQLMVPLPIDYNDLLTNNKELIGHFMYTPEDLRALIGLVRSHQIDLSRLTIQTFSFEHLPEAITVATCMKGLDGVVVTIP